MEGVRLRALSRLPLYCYLNSFVRVVASESAGLSLDVGSESRCTAGPMRRSSSGATLNSTDEGAVPVITSRERVSMALSHQEADRVPIDLGGGPVSGMHVDEVYLLRQALGLDCSGTPVKVTEPFQMLGEIKPDLVNALGIDVVGLEGQGTVFGFKNEGWKPWTTFGGTPVLVPEGFNAEPEPNGDILLYPEGDRSIPPSGRMPNGGFYFDTIARQLPINDEHLNVEDNLEEFGPISESELTHVKNEADRLYSETDKAILGNFGGVDIGNAALVSGPMLKHPRGIRSFEVWLESTLSRRDYLYGVWDRQCEIALGNLAKLHAVIGERITAVIVAGMDFGMQTGPFLSPKVFRDLYKPFYTRINNWIHEHTTWKSFIHSCGSVKVFLPDFVELRIRYPKSRAMLRRRHGPRPIEKRVLWAAHLLGRGSGYTIHAAFRDTPRRAPRSP